MKIAVLGTGMVGRVIASKLVELGHDVKMGSRTSGNENAVSWAKETGGMAATFDEAAADAEVLFNCTNGLASLDALAMITSENIDGKVLVDVGNEIEMVDGKLRTLANIDNSLAKKIQIAYPKTQVVKSLNTMNANVMVEPSKVPGNHNVFMSGESDEAKELVASILKSFGWKQDSIIDLGGIDSAAGAEMLMGLWIAAWTSGNAGENGISNIAIVK